PFDSNRGLLDCAKMRRSSRLAADLRDLAATVHWLAERSPVSSGATGVERTAVDGAGLTPAAAPQLHVEFGELAGDDRVFDHDQAAAVARALAALFPLGGERHEAFADADAGAEYEGLFALPSRSRIHSLLAGDIRQSAARHEPLQRDDQPT